MGRREVIRYAQSAVLPYAPERVFDLVADVERYPEFLNEYRTVRIRAREGNSLQVDQVIGFAAVELTLSAVARLRRPESIVVLSEHALLGELEVRWDFTPSGLGTRVDFQMTLTPPSRFAAGLAEYLLSRSAPRTLQAFAERAQQMVGRGLQD
jgi:coenzyme Q-binding protein COQ10